MGWLAPNTGYGTAYPQHQSDKAAAVGSNGRSGYDWPGQPELVFGIFGDGQFWQPEGHHSGAVQTD